MGTFDAILKKARAAEATVRLCLAGDVNAQLQDLESQLQAAGEGWEPTSLGDTDPRVKIAQKIEAARARMKASEEVFRFRALPELEWSDLLAAHPARTDKQELFNAATMPRVLVSRCCIDPVMTPEQYDQLAALLNQAQRNQLFNTAWEVNTEATSVPFSLSASAILAARTGAK